ncbi:hypothetical protein G7068_00060 [Leucobacter viscericola]|uniref:Uncharacterized protein n=1 Tax=Leucobacter viscericola TaxID=2714935 RepID=A0A6G7XBF5_9MICO|nr:hypothetical protein [Leucobacter viscericola]QIK61779.1 hypothetical protein G7068_00060 [Leucobacter viscericola]
MTPEQKRAQIDKLRELADPQFNLSIPDGAKRAITLVADALEATPNTPDRGELAKLLAEKLVDACLTGLLDEEAVGLADAILAAYPRFLVLLYPKRQNRNGSTALGTAIRKVATRLMPTWTRTSCAPALSRYKSG